MMIKNERFDMYLNILHEVGRQLNFDDIVLDLGCGNNGYQAYGCDFHFKPGSNVESLAKDGTIRLIQGDQYHLPFDDGLFDVVLTDQVLEHVQDYSKTFSEISRVLKPKGVSLNFFPSRYTPLEPHILVPLGTILQARWWLWLWAILGVRSPSQGNMHVKEIVETNFRYLNENTNYMPKKAIERYANLYFARCIWGEKEFLKYSRRGRKLYDLSAPFPFIIGLYRIFKDRVLIVYK